MMVGAEVVFGDRKIHSIASNHVVPSVGYRVDSGRNSLIFSGDTSANDALWDAANVCKNLRYVLIETAFSNRDQAVADASKHLYPLRLAAELKKYSGDAEIYITHMKPGEEESIMAEISAAVLSGKPKRLLQGQVFDL